jgi:hypothetical protein
VLKAAGDTETTQRNIRDWLELNEGDPGFQLLTEKEFDTVIFIIFISTTNIIKISIYLFSKFFSRVTFFPLIQRTSPASDSGLTTVCCKKK